MSDLRQKIKQPLLKSIELVPYGRDIYLALSRERVGICYRGKFDSMAHAQAAASPKKNSHYDVINRNKAENAEKEKGALNTWFHDHDYPLLFWFSRVVAPDSVVLELGGSVGHFFYTSQNFFDLPEGICWTIAELPEAVSLGRNLAQERGESRLTFLESDKLGTADRADIFLTAGTLQYMDQALPELLTTLPSLPSHVLSHDLPMHPNKEYFTLQNLAVCEVPYRIYSRQKLEHDMHELGYAIKATWTNKRGIEIPFHRKLRVEGYCGHYFTRSDNLD